MFWFIICMELHRATEDFRKTADPKKYNVDTYINTEDLHHGGKHIEESDLN